MNADRTLPLESIYLTLIPPSTTGLEPSRATWSLSEGMREASEDPLPRPLCAWSPMSLAARAIVLFPERYPRDPLMRVERARFL